MNMHLDRTEGGFSGAVLTKGISIYEKPASSMWFAANQTD